MIRSSPVLQWVCNRLVPALAATTGEIDAVLSALDGRFIPPGPSGAPSRGMAHVLPTGRNFYSVDPKAIPSPLAWQVGTGLADRLVDRHLSEEGRYPTTVGLVVWGTAAMRTAGDDVAEILALIGVRPRWAAESGRVEGVELIPLAELGRPRIDVTVRISGFFRDAFPHVLGLLDDAFALVAGADGRARRPESGRFGRDGGPKGVRPQTRCLRIGHPDLARVAELADRRRPGRGLPGLGRLRLPPGPRAMGPALRGLPVRWWGPRPPMPSAAGSPRWRSPSRTRTTASTTSSTRMTISRTTVGWWRPSGP